MNGSLRDSYPVSIGSSIATRLGKSCVFLGGAPKGRDVLVIWVLAMLNSSKVISMKELARREGVDESYVSRKVNLTTLAPDIVAAILDATLPPEVTLFELAAGTPLLWEEQRGTIVGEGRPVLGSQGNSSLRELLLAN
jgi:hypothetical protein